MKTSMLTQHFRMTQLTSAMLPCPESPVETELGPGLHRKCAQLCSSSRVKDMSVRKQIGPKASGVQAKLPCSIRDLSPLCPELWGHTDGEYYIQRQISLHSSAHPYLAVLCSTLPLSAGTVHLAWSSAFLPSTLSLWHLSACWRAGASAHEHPAPQSPPHGIQCALVLLSMLLEAGCAKIHFWHQLIGTTKVAFCSKLRMRLLLYGLPQSLA